MADDTDERTPAQERADQAEDDRLARRRFEARQYGFSRSQAEAFKDSDVDIHDLRRLQKLGCPVAEAVRILRSLTDTTDLEKV